MAEWYQADLGQNLPPQKGTRFVAVGRCKDARYRLSLRIGHECDGQAGQARFWRKHHPLRYLESLYTHFLHEMLHDVL